MKPREDRCVVDRGNKALVRRFYEEIEKGKLEGMNGLVAEDYIHHSPPVVPGRTRSGGFEGGFQCDQRLTLLREAEEAWTALGPLPRRGALRTGGSNPGIGRDSALTRLQGTA